MRYQINRSILRSYMIIILCLFIFPINLRAELYMSLSGRVIDDDTQLGISNVKVKVENYDEGEIVLGSAISDKNGYFTIVNLPARKYGFDESTLNSSIPSGYFVSNFKELTPTTITKGKNLSGVIIKLRKGAIISGKVFAEDGITPLKDVKLQFPYFVFTSGSIIQNTISTNAQGEFYYEGLQQTSVGIIVICNGFPFALYKFNDLQFGRNKNVSIIIQPKTKVIFLGIVKDSRSLTPIQSAKVALGTYGSDNKSYGYDFTKIDGSFTLKGFEKGEYSLYVEADNYQSTLRRIKLDKDDFDIGVIKLDFINDKKKHNNKVLKNRIVRQLLPSIKINECSCCDADGWWIELIGAEILSNCDYLRNNYQALKSLDRWNLLDCVFQKCQVLEGTSDNYPPKPDGSEYPMFNKLFFYCCSPNNCYEAETSPQWPGHPTGRQGTPCCPGNNDCLQANVFTKDTIAICSLYNSNDSTCSLNCTWIHELAHTCDYNVDCPSCPHVQPSNCQEYRIYDLLLAAKQNGYCVELSEPWLTNQVMNFDVLCFMQKQTPLCQPPCFY